MTDNNELRAMAMVVNKQVANGRERYYYLFDRITVPTAPE